MKNVRNHDDGFTLIELMIVVAIVAILISVALPAYQDSVRKSNRSAAQSDLLAFSQAMEKEYGVKFTYANAVAGVTFPAVSPIDSDDPKYTLSITALTPDAYTLRASPTASQADDGYLELNNLGQKFWDRNNNDSVADSNEDSWE
ncbi:type IV pilin protein [Candidatus Marimicrobium litorale]|nr:type IV pilin protein [Candidatus Marimicrobium litorale]